MSTTNNFFRPRRHYRSVFREGKFLLNTEATEIQLEIFDRLREQIKQVYGPTFSIQDGFLLEADSVVGRVILRPGHNYIDGYPVNMTSAEDPIFSLGMSPSGFTQADFVRVPKTGTTKGGLALNIGGSTPIDAGKYLIVLEVKEELITAAQDPYLRSANLSESTADRHRLIVDVHLVPKFVNNDELQGLNLNHSPIPYRGSADQNLVDYIEVTSSGPNYALVSSTPITGAEQIDGRNLEIQLNNGNGTSTAAFPTSNVDIREFIHGTLVDSNGTAFHVSNVFVTPGNSTRITLQIDLEKTRPVQLTTFQSTPVITDSVPYRFYKRDLFVTSAGQIPEGKKFYPVAEVDWNGTSVTQADITDLRPKVLARDGVLDLIRNGGLNLTSEGATFWNRSTNELAWGDSLLIHSAFEGFDWTIPAGDTVSLFGGIARNEVLYVDLSSAPTGGSIQLKKGMRGVGELTQDSLRASNIYWIAKRLNDDRIYFNGRLVLNDLQTGYFYDVPDFELLPQDILTLGYSAMFDDKLADPTAFSVADSTAEFFANSYMASYSNRSITVVGDIVTLDSPASFQMEVGDLIVQGVKTVKITQVNTSSEVEVEDGSVLIDGPATITQVAQTVNIRTVDDGGGVSEQINSYLNTPVSKMLVRYDDNVIQSIGNLPKIAYSVTADGGVTWTDVNVRPEALSQVAPEVIPVTAGSDVRIRFFSATTSGDGVSVLESFRAFLHNRTFVGSLIGTGGATSVGARALEFRVTGDIENPNLQPTGAPTYNVAKLDMTSAMLVIEDGKVGEFKVQAVSSDPDGSNQVIHIDQNIVLSSDASYAISLSFANTTVPAGKVVKLLTQYISGGKSSNISLVLS